MDAGKSPAEIEAIVEPRTRRMFIANAVILPPGGLEAPIEPLPAETELPPADTSMTPATGSGSQQAADGAQPAAAPSAPATDAPIEDLP
jgi:hypothetical protein